MSLRYMSREVYQGGMKAIQAMKDQASRHDAGGFRCFKDSASSARQARWFSGAADAAEFKSIQSHEKQKQAEESLRTVMFLSCWGPN